MVLITIVALVATAAAVVGDAVGAFALVDPSADVEGSESRVEPAAVPTVDDGVIAVGKSMTGARALVFVTLQPAEPEIAVRFAVPAGCAADLEPGDRWPDAADGCTDPTGLTGTVSAVLAADADELVIELDMDVEPRCYANVVLGEVYTDDIDGCGG